LTRGAEQNPTKELQTKAVHDNTLVQAKGEGFEKIIVEDVEITKAPGKIELPKELIKGMLQSWKKSLPKGKSLEQGGILVRKKDGLYEWKPGKPGTSGAFTPNYGDVEADEKLVAVGHTHPYSKSEGGHTGVSFSGGDLASIVYEKNPLNIVRSGKKVFVLARTAKFNKLVKGLGDRGKKNLHDKIEALWDKVFSAHTGNVKQAAHAATKAVCKKYHLVYYIGKGATLKKVDTSK